MSLLPRRRRLLALALPLVVLFLMVVRAELVLATGRHYELAISGYDPRDLLRGQYLRYRIEWNASPPPSCVEGSEPPCCLCVEADATPENPRVRTTPCERVNECQAFIRASELSNLEKYFVPEDMGLPLERAIRDRRASIRVAVSPRGDAVIEELLLDGRPWREVVGEEPR
ncbi:MAG: GDYXXLXY domain-containing protein [Myxococcota bacterium]